MTIMFISNKRLRYLLLLCCHPKCLSKTIAFEAVYLFLFVSLNLVVGYYNKPKHLNLSIIVYVRHQSAPEIK